MVAWMIKTDKRPFRDGSIKHFVRVVEGYRPGPGLAPKQRTIKSFGYLEDQADAEKFMEEVRRFDATLRKETILHIEVPATARMYSRDNRTYNYGYKFLEAVYKALGIDDFIRKYTKEKGLKCAYSPDKIFKLLVFMRILTPTSKRASFKMKNEMYGMNTEFELSDVYRALDLFADFSAELQKELNGSVKRLIGRELSYAFYDVTNYFFQIDFPDAEGELRQRGVSKEHQVTPIVQMGLFMDGNGLPVSMTLFPGNTSDCLTLQPAMQKVRENYGLGRIIVVADKGMNTSKNIDKICQNGDGYVVSQILRGKKGKRYHDAMFDPAGYVTSPSGEYKYKLFSETYEGKGKDGKCETRTRQVLIYWDKADADMATRKREEKLKKARKAVKNNAYGIQKGTAEYLQERVVDPQTGEILDEKIKRVNSVNEDKAAQDARFDGYFCLITSEMDYGEKEIRAAYGGLWKIEQSFRIMKSGLGARPVFVRTAEHIEAHFLICFVALLLIRFLQHKMGKKAISAERLARTLGAATCHVLQGGIIHLNDVGGRIAFSQVKNEKTGRSYHSLKYTGEDEIAKDFQAIQEVFSCDFSSIFPRQEAFNKSLKGLVRSITKQ